MPSKSMEMEQKQLKRLNIVYAIDDETDAGRVRELAKKKGMPLATLARMALLEYVEREASR